MTRSRTRLSHHRRLENARPLRIEVLEDRRLLTTVTDAGPQSFAPGEILIGFEGELPVAWRHHGAEKAMAMAGNHFPDVGLTSGKLLQHLPAKDGRSEQITTSWKLPPGADVLDYVERLAGQPGVVFAEPNYLLSTALTSPPTVPSDPRFDDLWGMDNTGQTGGIADADIDAPEAWSRHTGSGSIVVGVIDTGVNYDHSDLAANIWVNPGEIPGNGVDDDNNGFVDDVRGWNFVDNDNDPDDDNKHGTHVAGTIGAVGDNGLGVAGVNWHVQIMPLKFLDNRGSGTTEHAIQAINYATNMRLGRNPNNPNFDPAYPDFEPVNIVLTNNSWGGGASSQALKNAIEASGDANMLFVGAAGNSGGGAGLPAAYNSDNIISVAATDHADELASFSSRGYNVDLAAPGDEIFSTMRNGYGTLSGTSMASPHVAGVAALVWDVLADTAYDDYESVRDCLFSTVDQLPSLAGATVTGGRVNAHNALVCADVLLGNETSVSIDDVSQLEGSSGATFFELTISRAGDLNKATEVTWATAAGTADPATDYTPIDVAAPQRAIFSPDPDSANYRTTTIQIPMDGDGSEESHETFSVNLLDADTAFIIDGQAVATILNDDTTISISGTEVTEGDDRVVLLDEFVPAQRSGLDWPLALEYGPDVDSDGTPDHLFVVSWHGRNVLRFDAETGGLGEVFVPAGSGGMERPNHALFGPDGHLYVVDSSADAVFRFDGTTGHPLPAFGESGATFISAVDGGLQGPRGIAFDAAGDAYVTSYSTDEVIKYQGPFGADPGERMEPIFVPAGSGGLDGPRHLVFGPDGELYVSSYVSDAVLRFDGETGQPLPADGKSGADFVSAGSAGLDLPFDIVFQDHDGDGLQDLFVTSRGTDEVLLYDGRDGNFIDVYVPSGSGGLDAPSDLEFTPDGNLLVSSPTSDATKRHGVLRYGSASNAVFTVSLSSPVGGQVSVDLNTSDGTATSLPEQSDYLAIPEDASTTIVFGRDEVVLSVLVPTVDDEIEEPQEFFTVELSNIIGASQGSVPAIGAINDDESAPPPPPTSVTDMYVWDIDFHSGKRGKKDVDWVRATVSRDSTNRGVADADDAEVSNATVTVNIIEQIGQVHSTIRTVSGTTNAEGVFEKWLNPLGNGLYAAEVVNMTHDTYTWNQVLDPVVGNDTDTNGNDFPEQWRIDGASAAAISALPRTSSPPTANSGHDTVDGRAAISLRADATDGAFQMDEASLLAFASESTAAPRHSMTSAADAAFQELDLDSLDDVLLSDLVIGLL